MLKICISINRKHFMVVESITPHVTLKIFFSRTLSKSYFDLILDSKLKYEGVINALILQ